MAPAQPRSETPGHAADRPAPSRGELGHALFRLWLLNVLAGTLVGSLWFFDAPADRAPWIRIYVSLALVSSVAVLGMAPAAAFLVIWRWIKSWRLACLMAGFVGAWFLAIMYTDTIVYRLLRYHFFDSAVLNMMLTEGSGDSIILGAYVWETVALVIGGLTLTQCLCAAGFARRIQRLNREGVRGNLLLQPKTVVVLGFLPTLLFSQSVSAAADVAQHREALRAIQPIPVVPRVRLGQIIEPLLDPEAERPPEMDLLPVGARLDWPHQRPVLPADSSKENVFICVLDSWRRDMFSPELTPRISEFAAGARVFEDHLSGGNGTRYGLFTMLYGLHGSYWFPMLAQRRAPVMVEALQRAGYDVINSLTREPYGTGFGVDTLQGETLRTWLLPPGLYLIVQPGADKGLAELCAEVGEGVYVTSWLGGNADGTTGDFSFGLRGHLVENGELGAPVGEMNVTGNLLDLFASLAMVGNDPWPYRSTQVPTLVFEGVDFSGA